MSEMGWEADTPLPSDLLIGDRLTRLNTRHARPVLYLPNTFLMFNRGSEKTIARTAGRSAPCQ